jgi:FecR protein
MKRREFMALLSGAVAMWPFRVRAQDQDPPKQGAAADNSVGQVATLQGSATVTRGGAAAALKVADHIFEKDILQTGTNAALGVTFDDQTTFSLSANTRIAVDEFVYHEGGKGNAASFNVATGTAAFVASLVAKTGNMAITTPDAALGIRGTTGIVEVPETGATAAPTIKLYPDADGHVGRIEVFDRAGGSLGALTQGASAFSLQRGSAGRITAVPYQIPALELQRDRGLLVRLNTTHALGRRQTIRRGQLRRLNQKNNKRGEKNNGGSNSQQNFQQPGGLQQQNLPVIQPHIRVPKITPPRR